MFHCEKSNDAKQRTGNGTPSAAVNEDQRRQCSPALPVSQLLSVAVPAVAGRNSCGVFHMRCTGAVACVTVQTKCRYWLAQLFGLIFQRRCRGGLLHQRGVFAGDAVHLRNSRSSPVQYRDSAHRTQMKSRP